MTDNQAQREYWNEGAGNFWADWQQRMDAQLEPLGLAALDALMLKPDERVLDVGCGCGHTTFEVLERNGPGGTAVGLDISAPMLQNARNRAVASPFGDRVKFVEGDAQIASLEQIGGPIDAIFSRFGVMFFADPTAAFQNLRTLTNDHGRLAFVCWQSPTQNRAFSDLGRELLTIFPDQQRADPNDPGPFSFADPDRIRAVLHDSGWANIVVDECVRPMQMFGSTDKEEVIMGSLRIGSAGRLMPTATEDQRQQTEVAARRVIDEQWTEGGAIVDAVCWLVTATKQ